MEQRSTPIAGLLVVVWATAFASTAVANGDVPFPLTPYEVSSSNGQWIARVTPSKQGQAAKVSVKGAAGEAGATWEVKLSNKDAPSQIRVSDDGRYVVTFDNWASIGYGDAVLAFYTREGQRRKYSLEQMLGRAVIDSKDSGLDYTASSRGWRTWAIDRFIERDGKTVFAMWGAPAMRWMAWDAASGDSIAPDETLRAQLTDATRRWARRCLNAGERDNAVQAIRFLAHHRLDREAIERQLASADFHGVRSLTRGDGDIVERVEVISDSDTRRAADGALAEWDGKRAAGDRQPDRPYVFLGEVHGTIDLPRGELTNGILHLYLVPEVVPETKWTRATLPQRIDADLSQTSADEQAYLRKQASIGFRIAGVIPARYWLKVVFDSAEPHGVPGEEAPSQPCTPGAGDYESTQRSVIDVKPGTSIDTGTIRCTSRVN